MRLIIDSTHIISKVKGMECRLWTGYAGSSKVNVWIPAIELLEWEKSADLKRFNEELLVIHEPLEIRGEVCFDSIHV